LAVLKLIFDRLEDVTETSQIHADTGRIILNLARFVHRSGNSIVAVRMKTKFCSVMDSFIQKRDLLGIRKENHVRNAILLWISEWAFEDSPVRHDFQKVLCINIKRHSFQGDASWTEYETLQKLKAELDLACLRTSVELLERLQLQPLNGTASGSESVHVQSRLFYRYFSFFTKAVARWQLAEVCGLSSLSQQAMKPWLRMMVGAPVIPSVSFLASPAMLSISETILPLDPQTVSQGTSRIAFADCIWNLKVADIEFGRRP
jgi:hypothetical protein